MRPLEVTQLASLLALLSEMLLTDLLSLPKDGVRTV